MDKKIKPGVFVCQKGKPDPHMKVVGINGKMVSCVWSNKGSGVFDIDELEFLHSNPRVIILRHKH